MKAKIAFLGLSVFFMAAVSVQTVNAKDCTGYGNGYCYYLAPYAPGNVSNFGLMQIPKQDLAMFGQQPTSSYSLLNSNGTQDFILYYGTFGVSDAFYSLINIPRASINTLAINCLQPAQVLGKVHFYMTGAGQNCSIYQLSTNNN